MVSIKFIMIYSFQVYCKKNIYIHTHSHIEQQFGHMYKYHAGEGHYPYSYCCLKHNNNKQYLSKKNEIPLNIGHVF